MVRLLGATEEEQSAEEGGNKEVCTGAKEDCGGASRFAFGKTEIWDNLKI